MADEAAARFMKLFAGYADAHGTYEREEKNASKSGKMEIKRTARTVREPITIELWRAHLSGEKSLGVIPIRADSTCLWGCIDIDVYDGLSLADLVKNIEDRKFPLVVCRSKSGGAHVFLFLRAATDASDVQAALRQMAAALGHGGCEIFPKQTQILAERGDLGNWLNMPYFGGDQTNRAGVKRSAAIMSVSEFLRIAEAAKADIRDVDVKTVSTNDETLNDGPPCLQHLAGVGFPEGTRNNGMFALGVFCKKKFGERWADVLEKYNREYMKPPLDSGEMVELIKNLERKEYNYRCKDSPIVEHCNATLCRTRRWGVGGGQAAGTYPTIGGLSVLDTEPPLWFVDVDGRRVEVTTEQLQNYRLFQKVCMEKLHICYQNLTQNTWVGMVGSVMQQVTKIEAPPDTSIHGYFLELLESFCTNRYRAETKEGLVDGKPWEDDETGRIYFRLSGLTKHLDTLKFTYYGRNKISSEVRALGGTEFLNIGKTGVRVLWVHRRVFVEQVKVPLPKRDAVPI